MSCPPGPPPTRVKCSTSRFSDRLFRNRRRFSSDEAFLEKTFTVKGLREAFRCSSSGRLEEWRSGALESSQQSAVIEQPIPAFVLAPASVHFEGGSFFSV